MMGLMTVFKTVIRLRIPIATLRVVSLSTELDSSYLKGGGLTAITIVPPGYP